MVNGVNLQVVVALAVAVAVGVVAGGNSLGLWW